MVRNVFVFVLAVVSGARMVEPMESYNQPSRGSAVWGYFAPPLLQRLPQNPKETPLEAMVDLTNNLGVAILLDHVYSKGNFAFSPYGVASVLVVLYEGARGESARQIHRAVGFPFDKDVIRIGFRDVHRHLRSYFSHEGYLSGISLNKDCSTLKPEYKRILRFYGYDVEMNEHTDEDDTLQTKPLVSTDPTDTTSAPVGNQDTKKPDLGVKANTTICSSTVSSATVLNNTTEPSQNETTTESLFLGNTKPEGNTTDALDSDPTSTVTPTALESTTKPDFNESTPDQKATEPAQITTEKGAESFEANLISTASPTTPETTVRPVQNELVDEEGTETLQSTTERRTEATVLFTNPQTTTTEIPIEGENVDKTEETKIPKTEEPETTTAEKSKTTTEELKTTRAEESKTTTEQPKITTVEETKTTEEPKITTVEETKTTEEPKITTVEETNTTTEEPKITTVEETKTTTEEPKITTVEETKTTTEEPKITTVEETKTTTEELKISTTEQTETTTEDRKTTTIVNSTDENITTPTQPTNVEVEISLTLDCERSGGRMEGERCIMEGEATTENVDRDQKAMTSTTPDSKQHIEVITRKNTIGKTIGNLDNGMLIPQAGDRVTTTEAALIIKPDSVSTETINASAKDSSQNSSPSAEARVDAKNETRKSKKIFRENVQIMNLLGTKTPLWLKNKSGKSKMRISRTITDYLKSPHTPDMSLQLQNGMYDTHVSRNADLYRSLPKLLFLVDGAVDTPVPMMTHTNIFPYAYIPKLHAKALEFPLDDVRYKLLILLPVERRGLRQLIYDMMNYPLRNVLDALKPVKVKAVVPTFMVEGFVILTSSLQKIGIWDVFDPRKANLSGMSVDPELYVRNVEQSVTVVIRNYVEILDIQTRTMAARYIDINEFEATHPFLYFVLDTATNVALMAGQILDPLNSRIY